MTSLTNVIILGAIVKDKETFHCSLLMVDLENRNGIFKAVKKLRHFVVYIKVAKTTKTERYPIKSMFHSQGYFRFSLALSDGMYGIFVIPHATSKVSLKYN